MNYLMTADQALEFFKRCQARNAVTIDERLKVAEEMSKERLAFRQTDEQVEKRIKGKKVMHIKTSKPKSVKNKEITNG